MFQVFFWYYFFSALRMSLSDSFRLVLPATNPFCFPLWENVFILPFFLKDIFSHYRILGSQRGFLLLFKYFFGYSLMCTESEEHGDCFYGPESLFHFFLLMIRRDICWNRYSNVLFTPLHLPSRFHSRKTTIANTHVHLLTIWDVEPTSIGNCSLSPFSLIGLSPTVNWKDILSLSL